ncbi:MAG: thioredoxin domain-containing protein, partial [Candidatus Cloacimonadota bacterium]|nr:thioredoxin domain-containing protein [Candidatus Cloacimonadota bacterium]
LNFWKEKKIKIIPLLTLFFILTISLISFYPDYWNYTLPHDTEEINTGITEDGHPWIGARNPELTIIEFSDYLCFQCKKMHFFLRNIVSSSPERLRLVHRNFPMDHRFNPIVKGSFHNGAGILALIAISAVEQNRFWETNDYLYRYDLSEGAIYLRKIAEDLNTDLQKLQQNINNKSTRVKLTKDIIFGIKHKFEGTPVYIINDQVYTGQIPLNIIQSLKK